MAFDAVTYILAKNGAKAYTDDVLATIGTDLHFKGGVSTVQDLPTTATKGDCYAVGTLGMFAYTGTVWVSVSKQGPQGLQGIQGVPGQTGPAGRDGAIQYYAGTGISILFNDEDGKHI